MHARREPVGADSVGDLSPAQREKWWLKPLPQALRHTGLLPPTTHNPEPTTLYKGTRTHPSIKTRALRLMIALVTLH